MLLVADIVALCAGTILASEARFGTLAESVGFEGVTTQYTFFEVGIALTLIWLVALWLEGLYDLERLSWGKGEFSRVLRGLALGVVAFILFTYAIKAPGLSRAWTLLAFGFAAVLVMSGRLLVRAVLRYARRRGSLQRRALIVGCNDEGRSLLELLSKTKEAGLSPVGYLSTARADVLPLDYCSDLAPCFGTARDVLHTVIEHEIDTVIIASSAFDHAVIARMIAELRSIDVSVHLSSGLFDVLTSRVLVREVAGVPLITVKGVPMSRTKLATKRFFDLLVASAIVIAGLPVWLLLVLAISVDSRGPILYRQPRVGQHGRPFGMLKFRSMCDDADARLEQLLEENEADGPLFKMKNDPRVTRVGKWMRKFSVDEFPQLLNVLRGEMSLVGPRPPLVHETEQYTDSHWRRMQVPPGMTGLWQVSGRSSLSFEDMVRLDLYYIENWSVGFDVGLIARTVPAVLFARGAY